MKRMFGAIKFSIKVHSIQLKIQKYGFDHVIQLETLPAVEDVLKVSVFFMDSRLSHDSSDPNRPFSLTSAILQKEAGDTSDRPTNNHRISILKIYRPYIIIIIFSLTKQTLDE